MIDSEESYVDLLMERVKRFYKTRKRTITLGVLAIVGGPVLSVLVVVIIAIIFLQREGGGGDLVLYSWILAVIVSGSSFYIQTLMLRRQGNDIVAMLRGLLRESRFTPTVARQFRLKLNAAIEPLDATIIAEINGLIIDELSRRLDVQSAAVMHDASEP